VDVTETVHRIHLGTQSLDTLDGETARRTVMGLVDFGKSRTMIGYTNHGHSFNLCLLYTNHTEGLEVIAPSAGVVLLFTVDRFSHRLSVNNTTLI